MISWIHRICELAWEKWNVPEDWTKAVTVSAYKRKGNRSECGNYSGISLLGTVGKVYGKIVIEREQKIMDSRRVEKGQGMCRSNLFFQNHI